MEAVRDTSLVTYILADAAGEPIKGIFYGPELQKLTPRDYFDTESILDTRWQGNVTEYLVKWASYPACFNSWESDVVQISGSPVMRQRRQGSDGGAGSPRLHGTWYNVPDLAGQTHTAAFSFLAGHLHPTPRGDDRTETAAAETEGTIETPSSHACEGSTVIKSRRTLIPGNYEHVKQIFHDLNGHGGSSRLAFQFSYHAVRNRVLVAFRPVLKDCTGQVMLSRALSLLLGRPDQETVLMGRDNTRHVAPSQPGQDPVESLFVHCDLAAGAHMVGNVRNCLLRAVPAEGRHSQVMCYEPQ